MNKTLVLLSGGVDSAVALWQLQNQGVSVIALTVSFNHQGGNGDEVAAARQIAQSRGVEHHVLNLDAFGEMLSSVPGFRLAVGGQIGTCKPNGMAAAPMSVAVMHSAAMMLAAASGVNRIVWALHKDDLQEFDRAEMIGYVKSLHEIGTTQGAGGCQVDMPFLDMTKADIVRLGVRLGVPIEATFSCLEPIEAGHCGQCRQCRVRDAAIEAARNDMSVVAA